MRRAIDDFDEDDQVDEATPEADESSEGDAHDVDMCVDEPDAQTPVSKVKTMRDFSIVESKKWVSQLKTGAKPYSEHEKLCSLPCCSWGLDGSSMSVGGTHDARQAR